MDPEQILTVQVLFLGGITIGYHSGSIESEIFQRYITTVARFAVCLLISQGLELSCSTVYNCVHTRQLPKLEIKDKFKNSLYILVLSVGYMMYQSRSLLGEDLVMLLLASAGVRYLETKRQSATITYGEGMACSYAEGYLYLVIPPNGDQSPGLEGLIRAAEGSQQVVFPVRSLLIVITKSLFCPPNLEAFNNNDEELPRVEALTGRLGALQLDVAGVQRRVYRSTAYRVSRGAADPRPLYVVAECATPLHTLWKVLQKRAVYHRLATADGAEITAAFCTTLPRIVASSPELRGKCDLVYYDDTNPNENLAEVLIAKVRELEPNFENITRN